MPARLPPSRPRPFSAVFVGFFPGRGLLTRPPRAGLFRARGRPWPLRPLGCVVSWRVPPRWPRSAPVAQIGGVGKALPPPRSPPPRFCTGGEGSRRRSPLSGAVRFFPGPAGCPARTESRRINRRGRLFRRPVILIAAKPRPYSSSALAACIMMAHSMRFLKSSQPYG